MCAAMGKYIKLAAARLDLLHVGVQLFKQIVVRRHHDYRHVGINQRQWAVFKLPGRVSLGMDLGNFLELECAFHRDGVMFAATQKQRMFFFDKVFRDSFDLRIETQ